MCKPNNLRIFFFFFFSIFLFPCLGSSINWVIILKDSIFQNTSTQMEKNSKTFLIYFKLIFYSCFNFLLNIRFCGKLMRESKTFFVFFVRIFLFSRQLISCCINRQLNDNQSLNIYSVACLFVLPKYFRCKTIFYRFVDFHVK
jgi:hypothetical protein